MAIEPQNSDQESWSVYRTEKRGSQTLIEGDLPEIIARDMVADYASEGVTCVMQPQRTATLRNGRADQG